MGRVPVAVAILVAFVLGALAMRFLPVTMQASPPEPPAAVPGPSPPADAAPKSRIRVQVAGAYPSGLPQYGTAAISLAKKVLRMTGGKLDLRYSEPGAERPTEELFDAVAANELDALWASPMQWFAKEATFGLFGGLPFGPPPELFAAWLGQGGGKELHTALYARYRMIGIPCGLVGPEGGGWFRREIHSSADLRGMRLRVSGFGALVVTRLGVEPQQIAGGEIFQALQLGSIDGSEFSTPVVDLALGFHQAARNYYIPGWHHQAGTIDLVFSSRVWSSLPDHARAAIESGCGDTLREALAETDAMQSNALREIEARGVRIRNFPPDVLVALRRAWAEVETETRNGNADFRAAMDSLAAFLAASDGWRERGYLR